MLFALACSGKCIDDKAAKADKKPERDRPDDKSGAPSIEVTPEMIEAGFKVLCRSGIADECLQADRLVVAETFLAMAAVGYGLNYLIDIDNAVIVDVEATPARTYDEVAATKTMLDRTEACFDLKPKRLAADTAYGTGKFLGWLVKEKRIAPHIPVWERPKREDGKFSSSDFRWDGRRSVYICPNGKQLRTSGTVHSDGRQRYRSRKSDCDACPLRAQCGTKNEPHHIARAQDEDQGVPQVA
jgi:hypothetical protein